MSCRAGTPAGGRGSNSDKTQEPYSLSNCSFFAVNHRGGEVVYSEVRRVPQGDRPAGKTCGHWTLTALAVGQVWGGRNAEPPSAGSLGLCPCACLPAGVPRPTVRCRSHHSPPTPQDGGGPLRPSGPLHPSCHGTQRCRPIPPLSHSYCCHGEWLQLGGRGCND